MLFWILQRLIVSLVLILCAHYIYIFLKTNLTTPKTRDLVNQPREKYKEMYEKINKNMETASSITNGAENDNNNNNENISQYKMKNELKKYLKDLKQTTNGGSLNNRNRNSNNSNNSNNNNIHPVSNTNSLFSTELSNTGFSTY